MKKYFYILFLALFLFPFAIAMAINSKESENVLLQGDSIFGNTLVTGSSITIDNEIKGDVFAFGEKVYVNGKIDGDLISAAKEIIVNGEINGNIRAAAQEIKINGKIERSVLGAGENIIIEKNAIIGRDLIGAAKEIDVNGTINGSLDVYSGILNINGFVGNNINYYSDAEDSPNTGLFVKPEANIKGDINYNAFGEIKGDGQQNIHGAINKYVPKHNDEDKAKVSILGLVGFILALILTTLAIVLIGGKGVKDIEKKMTGNIWKTIGIGIIAFFILPIIGIILIASGMGAFLGILSFLIWVLVLLLSLFLSGIAFGQMLIRKFLKGKEDKFLLNSIVGILIGYILIIIPFLGCIVCILGLWWGIGGIVWQFADNRKEIA